LTPRAAAFVDSLPDDVGIRVLRSACPEVLDLLARSWGDPPELRRLFDGLLFEPPRGGLRLPFAALSEISGLRHYAIVCRRCWGNSVWDSEPSSVF